MEIEVTQDKLAKALSIVSRVATGARGALPILNNVLIRADDGKVTLTATNLDVAVVDYLPVSKCQNGVITVPARLFAEFANNLPHGEVVKITSKDDKLNIRAGKYKTTINGALADDFPEMPEINEKKAVKFEIPADEFKNGVGKVIVACATDLTRPTLTGVYFNTYKKALYLAGTSGYRLADLKFVDKVQSEMNAIVPASSLQEVLRSISDDTEMVEILFGDAQIRFRLGDIEITSKLIEGSYPDYRNIIPKKADLEFSVDRAELVRLVKMASLFARATDNVVSLETRADDNVLVVAAISSEYGENKAEITTEVDKDVNIGLNARFLLDALNAMDEDEVMIKMSSENGSNPVVLTNAKNQDYQHMLMPINRQ